jgi:hypothetical protein
MNVEELRKLIRSDHCICELIIDMGVLKVGNVIDE